MTDEIHAQTSKAISDLQANGHAGHAEELRGVAAGSAVGDALLSLLRTTCDTILTAIEAIDPVSEMALEGLRTEIDRQLVPAKDLPAD